jgi:FkbM family methyltransferase
VIDFIKSVVKNNKYLYKLYTDLRYKNIAKTRNWVLKNEKYIKKNQLSDFVFYKNKAFCRVYRNVEFEYHPEILGGLLGLENKDGFELKEVEYILPLIKPGSTILDIGANFGFYSIIFAKRCKDAKIHCFEPVSETFEHLVNNIYHNSASKSIVYNNCGVGERNGTMNITTDLYAGNYLVENGSNYINSETVPIVSIDSYIEEKNIEKIDFIKCDIEGAELFMLKGSLSTINRDKPIIFIEIYDEWTKRFGHRAKHVVEYILKFGYYYEVIDRNGVTYCQTDSIDADLNKGSDFLFMKKK